MKMHFARIALLLGLTATAFAAETAPTKTPPKPVARVENASDSFPLSLQGLFGKDGKPEVSLRDKATCKSAWLKPGDSFGGWKLESVDVKSGQAVLTQGGRRLALRQAGETPATESDTDAQRAPDAPKLKSIKDSAFAKKFEEARQDPKFAQLMRRLGKESEAILRKSHPEYFKENGGFDEKKPGAILAQASEIKLLLAADSGPEAAAARPLMTTFLDAVEQAKPYQNPTPEYNGPHDEEPVMLRIFEEADRIYLERNGGK